MRRVVELGLAVAMLVATPAWAAVDAAPASSPGGRPDVVEPLRNRPLSRERYRALAGEWRAWALAHPADGFAWAQVARALGYAGEPCDTTRAYAERAVRLSPNDPEALMQLSSRAWSVWCNGRAGSPDEAIRLAERAKAADPDCDDARIRLWVLRLAQGDRKGAEAELAAMLNRGRIPEPMVDYAYNSLVGLEPHAVLLTNGDNDTYPLLALQVARGFRTDVAVVNVNMLNLGFYRRLMREGLEAVPVPVVDDSVDVWSPGENVMRSVLAQLVKPGSKRPVYFAVTAPIARTVPYALSLEGLVYRVRPASRDSFAADTARLRRNFGEVYRLQSATSPGLDWNAHAGLSALMLNYTAGEWQFARAIASRDRFGAGRAMERAVELAHLHHAGHVEYLLQSWASFDPKSPALARWKQRLQAPR